MDDKLLDYYERELTFIREMGAIFAERYPKIAGRLLLENDKCEDPHTERLIEAFALISGRIHKKIDDDFPEITESLLNITYPHYINPIPSISLLRFDPVKQNISESGYQIERGTEVLSKPIKGSPCRFSTTQDLHLWPVQVARAEVKEPQKMVAGAVQVIEVELESINKINLSKIQWQSLRFFLNGPSQHVYHLYELLLNHVTHIECEVAAKNGNRETHRFDKSDIKPVGFQRAEEILPYSKRSFPGFLLLFEYFSFPEKFLFLDLCGMDRIQRKLPANRLVLRFFLNQPAKSGLVVNADTFCLNAVPVVNLFKRIAEPIRVEHRKTEYQVIPDIRRQGATEVYAVDEVTAILSKSSGEAVTYRPFYSMRHYLGEEGLKEAQTFWHLYRRASGKKDDRGTDVFLSFSDLGLKPASPVEDILTVRVTCTNRDMPSRLPFGDPKGDFNLESAAPIARIVCLVKPTPTRRPFLGGDLQWRLISHLSLNYMSLVGGGEEPLKEILKLYDFDNSLANAQQINGIVSIETRHVTKRIKRSFCRGIRVTMTFDEDRYVGTGLFMFATVLERFLGQYVSVNSFSQFEMKTLQREGTVKLWPPRSGNQVLI
ncbi:type VI secretion system baseplate subunit TssF [Desulfosarcina ovata]|uniref:Type VI secretion system protein n=1 Tax=Desulfosarcina ovata subsp. ovata TaxID=2752305 RepID=A0A5K8A8F9_9BACT|nr:type VI secretion system baseplate subunit TssF [Desulfosarcina ovata]BBO88771.1 type VI secretion system protein [Desulfosarcina ovata subsp. ovata]